MSKHVSTDDSTVEAVEDVDSETVEELAAQVDVLREENQRLRSEYVRARQTEYHRAALASGFFGVIAALGGFVFPDTRATLFALAGIGIVTGILTYFLTPEQFVTAELGERTYTALATLGNNLVSELGLQDTHIYVPTQTTTGERAANVRLFIPQHATYDVPDEEALSSLFVVTENKRARGASVPPTGATLFHEFTQTMTDSLADTPSDLADQLTEAVVQGFELADDVVPDTDPDAAQVTVGIRDSTFGAVDRFDHPLSSFIATGLAEGLDTPVQLKTITTEDDQFDYLLTYTWEETESDKNPY